MWRTTEQLHDSEDHARRGGDHPGRAGGDSAAAPTARQRRAVLLPRWAWRWTARAMSTWRIPTTTRFGRSRPAAGGDHAGRAGGDSRQRRRHGQRRAVQHAPAAWRWTARAMSMWRTTGNCTIRKVTPAGVVTTAGRAGGSSAGSADGTGSNARFYFPCGCRGGQRGQCLCGGHCTTTRFGRSRPAWGGQHLGRTGRELHGSADGTGSDARFYRPTGVAVDSAGNVYVADTDNNTIRKGVFTAYAPTNPVPYTPPPMNGQLVVTLLPPEANGQWRFPWELGLAQQRRGGEQSGGGQLSRRVSQCAGLPGVSADGDGGRDQWRD